MVNERVIPHDSDVSSLERKNESLTNMPHVKITRILYLFRARLTWSEAWGAHIILAPPPVLKLSNLNAYK